jgi:hypothetical protein
LLVHVAGFNLALVMRRLFGIGKPRQLQDGLAAAILGIFDPTLRLLEAYRHLLRRFRPVYVVAESNPGLRAAT